jgi:uracil-DNA glycosylase
LPLGYLPLAHPSRCNQPWLVKNPWFEEELVLDLQNVIQALKL